MKYANISFNNKLMILILITILVTAAVFMAGAISESAAYHDFADKRPLLGIPNFLNVISNLPFVMVGAFGLITVGRNPVSGPIAVIYTVLFAGVLLTGLGSAWYHFRPDNNTLVYDRLPMTIVFMSLLAATLSEFVQLRLGGYLLGPLLFTGVGSVVWWHYTGDLRIYILVQYYPILLIPVILFLFPPAGYKRGIRQLTGVFLWYFVAKVCDLSDRPIYSFTGFISGHSLKHLAASAATLYLVGLYQYKHLAYVS